MPLHDWHIEPREYARQEQRRGRRHAYERLDPATTALVVIDMVPFFVEENPYCRDIVPAIGRLADGLRECGGTVAWVLPDAHGHVSEEFYGAEVARVFAASGDGGLWHEFEVHDRDIRASKTASSAFFPGRSDLPAQLDERGIDTVLITGTVTNVCCESSARDASTLGYRVVLVADANAARRDRDHNATFYTVYRTFGDVRTTTEVLGLVRDGGVTR